MSVTQPLVRLVGVSHRYRRGPQVLDDVSVEVAAGESVAFMGPSGSGKTTLLSIVGLLTAPSTGEVMVDEVMAPRGGRGRHRLRVASFSWVFQTVNVLGHRSALDNVGLGLLARGVPRREANTRAASALAAVGLVQRAKDPVVELSGGELQRVCIARAMAAPAPVVLADEPTGQLDHATSEQVLDAMWAARGPETAVVVATHDPLVAQRCDRVLRLVDGRLLAGEQ